MAATKLEHRLSEVASSIGSTGLVTKQGPPQTWSLQAHIWLHIGKRGIQGANDYYIYFRNHERLMCLVSVIERA